MKILLGCGDDKRPGWVHHDLRKHSPHVEVTFDLEWYPWPWASESAERIEALDVLEHLFDTVRFMDEAWRVLEVGGRLKIRVPHCDSEDAWRDPTHRRAFHPGTFDYFDPTTEHGAMHGKFYTDKAWRLLYRAVGADITVELEKVGNVGTLER